jgi:hypothetical protein
MYFGVGFDMRAAGVVKEYFAAPNNENRMTTDEVFGIRECCKKLIIACG